MCDQRLSALRAGDKFPKGGTYFLGNLARAGDIFGGDILALIPAFLFRLFEHLVVYCRQCVFYKNKILY